MAAAKVNCKQLVLEIDQNNRKTAEKMKIALLLLLPLTLASVLPEGNHKEKGKKRFKALTFNTVLLNKDIQENDVSSGDPPNIVPRNKAENVNKVERRGKIVQQLLQSGADLICLQESGEVDAVDVAQLGLGDYAAMNTFEVNNLVSRYVSDKRTIILGDFNIGPADPVNSIAANGEGNYNILNGAFTTNRVYQCTFCGFPDNIYNQAMFETDSLMIDHTGNRYGTDILAICTVQIYWQYVWYRYTGNMYGTDILAICTVQIYWQYVRYRYTGNMYGTDILAICTVQINWQYVRYRYTGNMYGTDILAICTVQIYWQYVRYRYTGNMYGTDILTICTVQIYWQYVRYRYTGNMYGTDILAICTVQIYWQYVRYRYTGNMYGTDILAICTIYWQYVRYRYTDNTYDRYTDNTYGTDILAIGMVQIYWQYRMFAPVDASTRTSDADGNRPLSDHYGVMADICFK
ncbi:hypothetical protein MAR_007526 [Mya arenaria]|uniref:Endonuclease/exonuclease/phosphatase domain-containing protein n=1 Tax=Mya arenaria TaxID=6604 RepID=A0ABY7DEB1_MYAAR|nr:hypothetical protein MAR_007526 [Mya arenaria]